MCICWFTIEIFFYVYIDELIDVYVFLDILHRKYVKHVKGQVTKLFS